MADHGLLPHGLLLAILLAIPVPATAQVVITDKDKVGLDSTEGWAMAHTVASTLNLGALPTVTLKLWQLDFSTELGSIPRLSREEQRVGFGGFKLEDMNKSPVFGKVRMHVGLPAQISLELSWTPPVQINGGQPDGIYGTALERTLYQRGAWQLGGRIFALRDSATGDTTCSSHVASFSPGTVANPFGCLEASNDRITLDHEGLEFILSRTLANARWQPYAAVAVTRMSPHVQVNARVYAVLDRSELETEGSVTTLSLGTAYHATPRWSWNAGLSYTPLDVRRRPSRSQRSHDFWSVRLGLRWHGSS